MSKKYHAIVGIDPADDLKNQLGREECWRCGAWAIIYGECRKCGEKIEEPRDDNERLFID